MTALQDHFDVAMPTAHAPDKTYLGRRQAISLVPAVTVVEAGKERPLPPLREEDLFDWGYRGQAPANLARAILTDHLGYDPPVGLALRYTSAVVANLRRDGWSLASADVAGWLGRNLTRGRG